MPQLRISLLGRFEVRRDGVPVAASEWRGQKTRDLLKILLLARGRFVSKDQLLEWLWPGAPPAAAAVNLRSAVSDLRKVLEPGLAQGRDSAFILTRREGYAFDLSAPLHLDLIEFERLAAAPPASRAGLDSALDLYEGDLLEENPYAEWALRERDRLRELRLTLLHRRADSLFEVCAYAQCAGVCEAALGLDPSRETLWRLLMRTHARSGDRAAALAAFDRCRAALARDLGVDPLPETAALHAEILQQQPAGRLAPAPPAPASPRWLYRMGAACLALWAALTGAALLGSLAGIVRGAFVSSGDPGSDALPYFASHPQAFAEVNQGLYLYLPTGILLLPVYLAWFALLRRAGPPAAPGWIGLGLGFLDALAQTLSRAIGLAQILVLPRAYLQAPPVQQPAFVALWDVLRQLASFAGTLSLIAHPLAIILLLAAALAYPRPPLPRPAIGSGIVMAALTGLYYALPSGPASLWTGLAMALAIRLWFMALAFILWRAAQSDEIVAHP